MWMLIALALVAWRAWGSLSDRQAEDTAHQAEVNAYQAATQQYVIDLANFRACIDSIPRSDAIREQFEDDADRWDALAELLEAPEAKEFAHRWAEDIRTGAYLATAPKTPADCVNPGDPPAPPD